MHIKFDKILESTTFVTYMIEVEVLDESSKQIQYKTVNGFCTFDKKSEEISFDHNKTDSYFFNAKKEPAYILYHLRKLNRSEEPFPDIYDIVTC